MGWTLALEEGTNSLYSNKARRIILASIPGAGRQALGRRKKGNCFLVQDSEAFREKVERAPGFIAADWNAL